MGAQSLCSSGLGHPSSILSCAFSLDVMLLLEGASFSWGTDADLGTQKAGAPGPAWEGVGGRLPAEAQGLLGEVSA